MTADLAGELTSEMFEVLSPIDDIRADAVYRRTPRKPSSGAHLMA